MRVTIRSKNLELTPALQKYIELKLLKPLRRLLKPLLGSELPILDLEFSRTTRHHQKGKVFYAEANLSIGKTLIRAEATDEDMRAACDRLQEELERSLKKFKSRSAALDRQRARRAKAEARLAKAARPVRGAR